MFSCEFCKILKNTFIIEHLRVIVSEPVSDLENGLCYFIFREKQEN